MDGGHTRLQTPLDAPLKPGGGRDESAPCSGRLAPAAGTPTGPNPCAGSAFKGHAFVPKLEETSEVEWRDPTPGARRCGAPDPAQLERHVGPSRYCSPADVLARYAGGAALAWRASTSAGEQ